MRNIKYILVNETSSKNAARAISDSKLPGIGQCVMVDASSEFKNLRRETCNLEQRQKLIEELVRLRRHYPEAKILGVSELGDRCVHPSEKMNELRRELADLP